MKITEIDKNQALRYMGHKGEVPPVISEMVEKCEKLVLNEIRPLYVYRESPLEFTDKGVLLSDGNILLTGNDIKKHLEGCDKAIVFAATLSASADLLIRRLETSDMAEALAADALCSAAIEQVCDKAEHEIFQVQKYEFRTWRFSAGYGDLPISLQKSLTEYLNAQRRIGLTVTDNFLMIPRKSVTAIIGVSDTPLKKHGTAGCSACNLRDRCNFADSGRCSNLRTPH